MPNALAPVLKALEQLVSLSLGKVWTMLVSPGSNLSLVSLAGALTVAVSLLALQRIRRGRRVRLGVIRRALFPRRRWPSASGKADLGFLVFNLLIFGVLFGWLIVSNGTIAGAVTRGLTQAFGAMRPAHLPHALAAGLATLVLFLAAELGFWVDHYLSHRVPFLWAFHKVHHTAETLTPLTNYRLHPVDAVKFANILALFIGAASGLLAYLLGPGVGAVTFSDRNLIGLVFVLLVLHLQHSHIWLAATGPWGRIFLSPAHHQIHHSTHPADFNKNFGSFLSIWDWIFGTLRIPERRRERLTFGVAPIAQAQHSITGCLITPFVEAVEPWLAAPTSGAARVGTEGLNLE